jgi:hypothetical protein
VTLHSGSCLPLVIFLCPVETSVTDATDFLLHRPSGHFWLSASLPLGGPDSPAQCSQDRAPVAICCRVQFFSICLMSSRVSAQVGVAPDPFSSAPKRAGATVRPVFFCNPIHCFVVVLCFLCLSKIRFFFP